MLQKRQLKFAMKGDWNPMQLKVTLCARIQKPTNCLPFIKGKYMFGNSDREKDAFDEGYHAGWEFHMGTGKRDDCPYSEDLLWMAWHRGFDQAGDDS